MNGYYGLDCCPDGVRAMGWIGSIKIGIGIVTPANYSTPEISGHRLLILIDMLQPPLATL